MRVGFLSNQLDNRGTGNAMFDYAHYNERYLGNKSRIFTFNTTHHHPESVKRFKERFGAIYEPTNLKNIDVLYHIKSGERDAFELTIPDNISYAVHAVFNAQPHGDKYAVISKWMSLRDNLPYVPHIIHTLPKNGSLRPVLSIPPDATVIGRYGGLDSFDISWAWDAIENVLEQRKDMYFLFANTEMARKHQRILTVPELLTDEEKNDFINTCDAMLHARGRGETFGISVGEFATRNKRVLTYDRSYEKAHIYELLKSKGHMFYKDQYDLEAMLKTVHPETTWIDHRAYMEYTNVQQVMDKFEEVFLDD